MLNLTSRPFSTQLELWRPVPEFEGYYEISNLGQVKGIALCKRYNTPRILKPRLCNMYLRILLTKDRVGSHFYVHRLVAIAFLGEPPTPKHQVNHINLIRTDNRVENLEWVTAEENIHHGWRVGERTFKGEHNNGAKLDWEKVHQIRQLYKDGWLQREIAALFGVTQSAISSVTRKENWKEQEN